MGAAAPGHQVWLPLLLAKLFSALPAKSLCSAPAKRRSRGTPCWGGTEKRRVPLPVPLHKQLQESSRLTGSQRSPRLWPGLLVLCSGSLAGERSHLFPRHALLLNSTFLKTTYNNSVFYTHFLSWRSGRRPPAPCHRAAAAAWPMAGPFAVTVRWLEHSRGKEGLAGWPDHKLHV